MKWFRLYAEMKDDPKMLELDDNQFRVWINLLCMASESDDRGVLPPFRMRGMAAALHTTPEIMASSFALFKELGMVDELPSGGLLVTNFMDRQYDYPSDRPEKVAERKSRMKPHGTNPERVKNESGTSAEREGPNAEFKSADIAAEMGHSEDLGGQLSSESKTESSGQNDVKLAQNVLVLDGNEKRTTKEREKNDTYSDSDSDSDSENIREESPPTPRGGGGARARKVSSVKSTAAKGGKGETLNPAAAAFHERRIAQLGRAPTRKPDEEKRAGDLWAEHGEAAYRRALDGYFGCLGNSDDWPVRQGFTFIAFLRQFDRWEAGKPPPMAAAKDARNGGMGFSLSYPPMTIADRVQATADAIADMPDFHGKARRQ